MEGDPTGGMWIYLIFLIIPLARIIPRLLRKYRSSSMGASPDHQDPREQFFTNQKMPEPPRFREKEPAPDKKDGWVGKDDFK